ncbi:MAG: hypothetical protein WDM76_02200 [Limisphaerales bacterium]
MKTYVQTLFGARTISIAALMLNGVLQAAPYASNIRVVDTSVTFILNEPADALKYRINNGPLQTLDGSTKGSKSFSLNAPTDKFVIIAGKNSPAGYTIPTGDTIAAAASGLSQPTAASGFNLISDDANPLVRFNSPRGVSVSNKPGATNFGTAYIANSAAGSTGGRSLGDGLYAINADQSDAFGYGDTAQDSGNFFDWAGASANSPFRIYVAANGEIYAADYSDANGNIYRENADLTAASQVLADIGGPPTIPSGQNHGSTTAVYVEGSLADGNLVVYTLDEDLQSGVVDDRNSLWRYDIGAGTLPSTVVANKVNQSNVLLPLATSDMQRGADGKWYLSQNRSAGGEPGVAVLDADGVVLFDSLTASRTLLGNSSASDILRNVTGISVSEDQKWLGLMLNNSDVAVVPLVDGIPDLANRLVVDTGTDVNSGRDIAFDAAGNIHYVSSGQAFYRVLAPGGNTWATTAWNGSAYLFKVASVPELTISHASNQITIEWPGGVLEESSSLTGPWNDSATQTSPYIFTPTEGAKFFRLRGS